MTGLPAAPAILAALPLRGLPRLPLRLAALPGPMGSFDVGAPELLLSIPSRRSSSATRSSSRRSRSSAAASSARSIAFSASLASTTARSRASSSRCSPAERSGTSGTSPDHPQPELQVQAPHEGVSRALVPHRQLPRHRHQPRPHCARRRHRRSRRLTRLRIPKAALPARLDTPAVRPRRCRMGRRADRGRGRRRHWPQWRGTGMIRHRGQQRREPVVW
jgi:hypothetical protein